MRTSLVLAATTAPFLWAVPFAAIAQPCPQITSPPVSQRICPDASPTLSVAATGGEPLAFQWQVLHPGDIWTDIAEGADVLAANDFGGVEFWAHSHGSSSPQLHLNGISPAAGTGPLTRTTTFRCVVAGTCGAATSPPADLTICRVDANCDGQFTPADVAAFINAWFTGLQQGTLAGDFDFNGFVAPDDVASYVSAWFDAVVTGNCIR